EGRREEARELQLQARQMIEACRGTGWSDLPAIRALAEHRLGIDLGPPRPPLRAVSQAKMVTIRRDLEAALRENLG
ncbi:MAG: hypothetical protein EBV34_20605, partial [Betaproteobacteria bacterium]|nr:hypothetical protein [Betaproteobacteria bacterium]